VTQAGERFGAYTLEHYLGSRGGELWRARSDDGAPVVVGVAPIGHKNEAEVRAKLAERLALALQIHHPNLVRVLGGGFERSQRFVVTEPVDGVDLARILGYARRQGTPLSPGLAGYIAHEVARALVHVHAQKAPSGKPLEAAHLEVSPRNIHVERSGAIKLSELMGPLDAQELILTAGQGRRGLVGYLSPELASSSVVGPASDVFALGAVLWEMLAGKAPFERETDLETLDAVRAAVLPAMPEGVPIALASLTKRCLAKEPPSRPTAHAMMEELATVILSQADAAPSAARRWAELAEKESLHSDPPEAAKTVSDKPAPAESVKGDAKSKSSAPGDPFYDPSRDGVPWEGSRFEVLERLGRGGMGEVYRVRDRELDEILALKLIQGDSTLALRSIERLKREVRIARKILSPFVCRIHDLVDLGRGVRGLTMAYVQGTTLAELMRSGVQVDYTRFARWGADIAEGLAAAHEISIIHRDLKPENVMIGPDDRAVILDFGIALSSEASQAASMKLTQAGMIMGTPLYMSPEQILNHPLDGRSDLFALGLMLAELITGEVPMPGSYPELVEKRVLKAEPYHVANVDPGTPPALAAIIDELLITKVEERPRSATEIARRLRAFAQGTPLESSKPVAPLEPPPPPQAPSNPPQDPVALNRMMYAIALLLLLAVIMSALLVKRREDHREEERRLEAEHDASVVIEAPTQPDASSPDAAAKDSGKRGPTKLAPIEEM
jgi:serine/threonine protein kinase